MPRQSRVVIPNYPHHILQRGHNKQTIFVENDDYVYYLDNLLEATELFGVKVNAYCLMTNHVHLLLNPGEKSENLGTFMKFVSGRQTRYVNRLEGRTGTLWEGRYKSSPVESEGYLLACCRYIEMNPVRAKMVHAPEEYEWSSYQEKIGLRKNKLIDPDPFYRRLGETSQIRQRRYRDFVQQSEDEREIEQIRQALQRGQLTGTQKFIDQVEQKIGLRVEWRKQGRPRNKK